MVATGAINDRIEEMRQERAQRAALAERLVTTLLAELRCRIVVAEARAMDQVGWHVEAE